MDIPAATRDGRRFFRSKAIQLEPQAVCCSLATAPHAADVLPPN